MACTLAVSGLFTRLMGEENAMRCQFKVSSDPIINRGLLQNSFQLLEFENCLRNVHILCGGLFSYFYCDAWILKQVKLSSCKISVPFQVFEQTRSDDQTGDTCCRSYFIILGCFIIYRSGLKPWLHFEFKGEVSDTSL